MRLDWGEDMQCEDCGTSIGHFCQGNLVVCKTCQLKRLYREIKSPLSINAEYQRQWFVDSPSIMLSELLCFVQNKTNTLSFD